MSILPPPSPSSSSSGPLPAMAPLPPLPAMASRAATAPFASTAPAAITPPTVNPVVSYYHTLGQSIVSAFPVCPGMNVYGLAGVKVDFEIVRNQQAYERLLSVFKDASHSSLKTAVENLFSEAKAFNKTAPSLANDKTPSTDAPHTAEMDAFVGLMHFFTVTDENRPSLSWRRGLALAALDSTHTTPTFSTDRAVVLREHLTERIPYLNTPEASSLLKAFVKNILESEIATGIDNAKLLPNEDIIHTVLANAVAKLRVNNFPTLPDTLETQENEYRTNYQSEGLAMTEAARKHTFLLQTTERELSKARKELAAVNVELENVRRVKTLPSAEAPSVEIFEVEEDDLSDPLTLPSFKLQQANSQKDALEEEVKSLNLKIKDTEESLAKAREDNSTKQETIEELERTTTTLARTLEESSKKLEAQRVTIDQLTQQVTEIAPLKERVETLKKETEELNKKLESSMGEGQKRDQQEQEDLKRQLQENAEELKKLKERIQRSDNINAGIAKQLEEKAYSEATLKEKVKTHEAIVATLRDRVYTLEAQKEGQLAGIKRLHAEAEDATTRYNKLNTELGLITTELRSVQTARNEAEQELIASRARVGELEAELRELDSLKSQFETDAEALNAEQVAEINRISDKLTAAHRELEAARTAMAEKKNALARKSLIITDKEEAITALRQEKAEIGEQLKETARVIAEKAQTIGELERELSLTKQALRETQAESAKEREAAALIVRTLEARVRTLEGELKDLQKQPSSQASPKGAEKADAVRTVPTVLGIPAVKAPTPTRPVAAAAQTHLPPTRETPIVTQEVTAGKVEPIVRPVQERENFDAEVFQLTVQATNNENTPKNRAEAIRRLITLYVEGNTSAQGALKGINNLPPQTWYTRLDKGVGFRAIVPPAENLTLEELIHLFDCGNEEARKILIHHTSGEKLSDVLDQNREDAWKDFSIIEAYAIFADQDSDVSSYVKTARGSLRKPSPNFSISDYPSSITANWAESYYKHLILTYKSPFRALYFIAMSLRHQENESSIEKEIIKNITEEELKIILMSSPSDGAHAAALERFKKYLFFYYKRTNNKAFIDIVQASTPTVEKKSPA